MIFEELILNFYTENLNITFLNFTPPSCNSRHRRLTLAAIRFLRSCLGTSHRWLCLLHHSFVHNLAMSQALLIRTYNDACIHLYIVHICIYVYTYLHMSMCVYMHDTLICFSSSAFLCIFSKWILFHFSLA